MSLNSQTHMSIPLAFLNGRVMPFTEAALPLHDAGFVSGATVVDNARTFRHTLFRWPDHLARFRRDCAACRVPLEMSDEQLTAAAVGLVSHNADLLPPGGELQLVTFATPGPLGFYLGEAENGPPTLGMATYPLPAGRFSRFFAEGVTLAIAGTQSSDPGDLLPPLVKHRSRMAWYLADRAVRDPTSPSYRPGSVPVLLNREGVGDTALGCIVAVVDGAVVRPVTGTVLESISAKVVAELCADLGLRCEEAHLDLREVLAPPAGSVAVRVSELILAGTGLCLAGVRHLFSGRHGRDFVWPGPIFQRLLAAWSERVNVDIGGEIPIRLRYDAQVVSRK